MAVERNELVYRITESTVRSNSPTELVITLKLVAGFIDPETSIFTAVSPEFPHTISPEGITQIMMGKPNADLPRIADLNAALGDYLIANKVIRGDLVD